MTTPQILLAKQTRTSDNPVPEETLVGHTRQVVECFTTLFGCFRSPTRLALQWLRFFKVGRESSEAFYVHGMAACGVHDMGKANSGFQNAVRGKHAAQVIRHEHLSGLLLWTPTIRRWLEQVAQLRSEVLISAVIGHHLKADHTQFGEPLTPDRPSFLVFPDGVREVLEIAADAIESDGPGEVVVEDYWETDRLAPLRKDLRRTLYRFRRLLAEDKPLDRLLRAVRAATIAADSAGSGLAREGHRLDEWLGHAFPKNTLLAAGDIEQTVIAPRVGQIERAGTTFEWTDFQNAAETLFDRALLLASCGSGKTLAAWRWIKGQLGRRPAARVIFLYPTRATATEGFRDYVSWAPEADSALIHGTSAYELQSMFENPADERFTKDFTTDDRLFAIAYWHRRIFSATVDQFLGFMQHVYRSMCLLPVLADSVLVIDEVHSFDRSLFSALKRFLREFDLPVLCMTASLPRERQRDLRDCGLHVFPENPEKYADLRAAAQMPRYAVRSVDGPDVACRVALAALEDNRRVLWVVNTVDRCQQLARETDALCYHSRFRLDDRKRQHKKAVAAFQPKEGRVLAVTTQVCEMSLDLDAHVLITEAAPITALIQRMGRCNRRAHLQRRELGQVWIYQPENSKPYAGNDLQGMEAFVDALHGKEVSQADLQEMLETYGPGEVEVDRYAAFVESGPWAVSREASLRDLKDFTVQAVLDRDVDSYLEMRKRREPTDGFLLPAPRSVVERDDRLGHFPMVAPSSHYSPRYGLFTRPMEADS